MTHPDGALLAVAAVELAESSLKSRDLTAQLPRINQIMAEVWNEVRARHKDVPAVAIGCATRGKAKCGGHFWAGRWRWTDVAGKPGRREPEVFVAAEELVNGANRILEILLHEAAHGLCHVRKERDVSGNQYHNAKFKGAAEVMGLSCEFTKARGYQRTRLAPGTAEAWTDQLALIREAITIQRITDEKASKSKSRNAAKAVCECEPPRIIRVAPKELAAEPIVCVKCGGPFGATE